MLLELFSVSTLSQINIATTDRVGIALHLTIRE